MGYIQVTVTVETGFQTVSREYEVPSVNPLYHASELDVLLEQARAEFVPVVARVFGDIRDRPA